MDIRDLSKITQQSFEELSIEDKIRAETKFDMNKKSVGLSWLLFFFLCSHYFYIGKAGKNILLWILILTGVGFIWLIVDIFRMRPSSIVKEYNDELAHGIIYNIKRESKNEK